MTLAVLDINDCNLQLWAGSQHAQGAGYALFSKGDYQFGNDARARARLEPRSTNTRYWWQLNTEPLQPALGQGLTRVGLRADTLYSPLLSCWAITMRDSTDCRTA